MKLSASQAAKETGKSVPTITRAIKSGRLSAEKGEGEGYLIDPAELFRVFPAVTSEGNETPPTLSDETHNETGALRAELEGMRQRLADKDDVIEDLRRRLDQEGEERRKLTALLVAPKLESAPPASPPVRWSWWPFSRPARQ